MERINSEATFVDHVTSDLGGPRTSEMLRRLDAAVRWKPLSRPSITCN